MPSTTFTVATLVVGSGNSFKDESAKIIEDRVAKCDLGNRPRSYHREMVRLRSRCIVPVASTGRSPICSIVLQRIERPIGELTANTAIKIGSVAVIGWRDKRVLEADDFRQAITVDIAGRELSTLIPSPVRWGQPDLKRATPPIPRVEIHHLR